jgi:creatinine amidohydrolase
MAAETEIEWMKLTFAELNARAAADALVIVPVASLEQHGPHLATGVDILCATEVAQRTARRMMAAGHPAVVTPCVWTGLAEHHVPFGGTVTLDYATFAAVLKGVVRSAARAGFKRAMLLNGHGGNAEAVAVAGGECQAEFGIRVAAGTYWHLAGDAFAPILERQSNVLHACEAETSMIQALSPETVAPLDRHLSQPLIPGLNAIEGVHPGIYRWQQLQTRSPLGLIGEAWAATPEKGHALLEAISAEVAGALACERLWEAPI